MTHYFKNSENVPSNRRELSFRFLGLDLTLISDDGIFSKSKPDEGSLLLAQSAIEQKLSGRVLDMGCGYGLVGLLLKKFNPEVTIDGIDVNIKAVECAIASAERLGLEAHYAVKDGREDLGMTYDAILLNPPIRTGKATIFELYRNAYAHLKPQGSLIIVIRRQQGSASSFKELQTIFPAVSRIKLHKGYEILKSIKD